MIKPNQHDLETFKHVLTDYLTNYGIDIPPSLEDNIIEAFFNSDCDMEPICAVQSGTSVLLASKYQAMPVQAFLFLDVAKKRFERFSLNDYGFGKV